MDSRFEITRQFWGGAITKGNLIYPNTQVIRFIKHNYKNNKNTVILDFGCGAGRNTLALLSEGYQMVAMDYTDEAIAITKEKCKAAGLENVQIKKNNGLDVPLDSNSIDVIVADGSLIYLSKSDLVKMLSNLKRVMKSGAMIWMDFRTKDDWLYGKGREIEEDYFEMGKETGREGCTYVFLDELDVKRIFEESGLKLVSLDDFTFSDNNRNIKNSWYHVVASKI